MTKKTKKAKSKKELTFLENLVRIARSEQKEGHDIVHIRALLFKECAKAGYGETKTRFVIKQALALA